MQHVPLVRRRRSPRRHALHIHRCRCGVYAVWGAIGRTEARAALGAWNPRSHTNPPTRTLQPNPTVVSQRSSLVVENRVAIRFTRMGRKKLPFYRIVAIDSRKRRDGIPLEFLGWYDPMKKEANLNAPAIRKWLSVGALPSETVAGLLKKAMVIE